jgi:hypothetical protein
VIQTEYQFTLPIGYLDEDETLHRDGVMRMATAADEILPLRDHRVQANQAYLIVILLSRVINRLGSVGQVTPKVIENLFAVDLAHLQELYNHINRTGKADVPASCPRCEFEFEVALNGGGE